MAVRKAYQQLKRKATLDQRIAAANKAGSGANPSQPWMRFRAGQLFTLNMAELDLNDKRFYYKDENPKQASIAELNEQIKTSLSDDGQMQPILVVYRPPALKCIVVDGWTRLTLQLHNGVQAVECKILDWRKTDDELKSLRWRMNELRRKATMVEKLRFLLKEKSQGRTWGTRELTRVFGFNLQEASYLNRALKEPALQQRILSGESIGKLRAEGPAKPAKRAGGDRPLFYLRNYVADKGVFHYEIRSSNPGELESVFKNAVADLTEKIRICREAMNTSGSKK